MKIERKVFEAEVKESDEKDLTVVHFISTERRDRGNDVLHADGMKVEGRPVVMLQHGWNMDVGSEPVAKNVWIKPGEFKRRKGIQAKTQFYPDDLGQRLWKKNVEGYMPNWSVGWRPIRSEDVNERGVEVRHVYEWELLEYSLVSVPMQPDAQTLAGKTEEVLFFKVLQDYRDVEEGFGEIVGMRNEDGAWEVKPYPNEHACRLENPDKYIRIRRENDKFGKGIHAIWGVQGGGKSVELQAIRFDKTKFTVAQARAWLKEHEYKCKLFEPASEKCGKCGKLMLIVWDRDVSGENCGLTCEASFTYQHDGECEESSSPFETKDGSITIGIHMISTLNGVDPYKEPVDPKLREVLDFAEEFVGRCPVRLIADDGSTYELQPKEKEQETDDELCACDGEVVDKDGKQICKVCGKPKKEDEKRDEEKDTFDADSFLKTVESKIEEKFGQIMVEIDKINSRLDSISVELGTENRDEDGNIINPPEPLKVIVVNSDNERKKSDEEKKRILEEIARHLSAQIAEVTKKVVPEMIREEFNRLKGKVS